MHFFGCFSPPTLRSGGAAVKCPCCGCQRCLFSVFQANVSFKIRSKVWLRELCSPWLFSKIFVYLIVGVDRLDKDLTIGQMQGKYLILLLQPYWNECSFCMTACCYGYSQYPNKWALKNLSIPKCSAVVKERWGR